MLDREIRQASVNNDHHRRLEAARLSLEVYEGSYKLNPRRGEEVEQSRYASGRGFRYQGIADFRVDLLRLKNAIASGRLSESSDTAMTPLAAADQLIEPELTEESPQVLAVSRVSRRTPSSPS